MPGILLDTKQKGILQSVVTLLVRSVPNSPALNYGFLPMCCIHILGDQNYIQIYKTEMAWSLPKEKEQVMQVGCNL